MALRVWLLSCLLGDVLFSTTVSPPHYLPPHHSPPPRPFHLTPTTFCLLPPFTAHPFCPLLPALPPPASHVPTITSPPPPHCTPTLNCPHYIFATHHTGAPPPRPAPTPPTSPFHSYPGGRPARADGPGHAHPRAPGGPAQRLPTRTGHPHRAPCHPPPHHPPTYPATPFSPPYAGVSIVDGAGRDRQGGHAARGVNSCVD